MAEQKTREIKFRAWDTVNKKMVDLHKLTPLALVEGINTSGKGLYLPLGEDTLIFEQYTGLKDKNGREIFEGDIIKRIDTEDTYIILWKTDGYVTRALFDNWLKKNILDRNNDGFLSGILTFDIEIIGNVHENPELLKEDNNG